MYFIDDSEKRFESGLYCFPPIDGNIAMQNLLKHLSICHKTDALGHKLFE